MDAPNRTNREPIVAEDAVGRTQEADEVAVTGAARVVLVERSRPVVAVRTWVVKVRIVAETGSRKKNMGVR